VDLRLSGGRLVTPRGIVKADLAIDDGKIVTFGRGATLPPADEVIHLASSSLLLPGVVDIHAHLRDLDLSGKGTFESETQAAAAGGITFALDMPNSRPPTLDRSSFEAKKERAIGRCAVDFGFNMGVYENHDRLLEVEENLAYGEVFVGPSTGGMTVGYGDLDRALRILVGTGKAACVHAEDPEYFRPSDDPSDDPKIYDHAAARPPEAEIQAVSRVLHLNEAIGARIHFCHISTRGALRIISRYKSLGMPVTCEVTPHHLILTHDLLDEWGPVAKMNPPLRGSDDVSAMLEGILSGTVDLIASDHAPHSPEEKGLSLAEAPSGIPGFETFIPAVLTYFEENSVPPSTFVKLTSVAPARLFNVPGKGFARGKDADLTVVDTVRREVDPELFLSKARYSPFAGMKLKYWPVMTMVRGEVIMDGGEITIKTRGRFVPFGDEPDGR